MPAMAGRHRRRVRAPTCKCRQCRCYCSERALTNDDGPADCSLRSTARKTQTSAYAVPTGRPNPSQGPRRRCDAGVVANPGWDPQRDRHLRPSEPSAPASPLPQNATGGGADTSSQHRMPVRSSAHAAHPVPPAYGRPALYVPHLRGHQILGSPVARATRGQFCVCPAGRGRRGDPRVLPGILCRVAAPDGRVPRVVRGGGGRLPSGTRRWRWRSEIAWAGGICVVGDCGLAPHARRIRRTALANCAAGRWASGVP